MFYWVIFDIKDTGSSDQRKCILKSFQNHPPLSLITCKRELDRPLPDRLLHTRVFVCCYGDVLAHSVTGVCLFYVQSRYYWPDIWCKSRMESFTLCFMYFLNTLQPLDRFRLKQRLKWCALHVLALTHLLLIVKYFIYLFNFVFWWNSWRCLYLVKVNMKRCRKVVVLRIALTVAGKVCFLFCELDVKAELK